MADLGRSGNADVISAPESKVSVRVIRTNEELVVARHAKKVAAAGGKILGEPWDIPGVGLYVSFLDTEGNRVSMLQPKDMMEMRPK